MAIKTEQPKEYMLYDFSCEANASLVALQNCVVIPTAAAAGRMKCAAPGGQGVLPLGVLLNAPASGAQAEVRTMGVVKVKANGAFNAGIQVCIADTAGTVAAASSGDFVLGISLEASAEAGHLVSVLLTIGGQLN